MIDILTLHLISRGNRDLTEDVNRVEKSRIMLNKQQQQQSISDKIEEITFPPACAFTGKLVFVVFII